MKRPQQTSALVLLFTLLLGAVRAQTGPQPLPGTAQRVAFLLKTTWATTACSSWKGRELPTASP
jgi:hypothetical protein